MPVITFLPQRKIAKKPNVPQYEENPTNVGGHLRKARMLRGQSQKDAAVALGVSEDCVTYWETGRSEPQVRHYPAIISYIGYYPLQHETETPAGKLRQLRHCLGLSVSRCAAMLLISTDAVKRWERGKQIASQKNRILIERAWKLLPVNLVHPV